MLFIPFIFMPAFPLGRVAGAAALGGLEIPQDQQHFRKFCWLHTKTRPIKVGVVQYSLHLGLDDLGTTFPWV